MLLFVKCVWAILYNSGKKVVPVSPLFIDIHNRMKKIDMRKLSPIYGSDQSFKTEGKIFIGNLRCMNMRLPLQTQFSIVFIILRPVCV